MNNFRMSYAISFKQITELHILKPILLDSISE